MGAVAGQKRCLVFMPMLAGFESVRAGVARGVRTNGTIMLRLEEALADADWQHWLVRTVPQASIVLGDVTDHNPFVMYELGIAHARRIPTLLIVDSRNERVSSTVLGTPFIPYDTNDLEMFEKELAVAIQDLISDPTTTPDVPDSYGYALTLADAFATTTGLPVDTVSLDEFATRLDVAADRGDLCPAGPRKNLYVLSRAIRNADDVALMRSLLNWSTSGATPLPARPR